jgi:hypothetical protein
MLTELQPRVDVDCAWVQRLTVQYDESLSNFASNFNLCRYAEASADASRDALFAYGDVCGALGVAEAATAAAVAAAPRLLEARARAASAAFAAAAPR